MFTLLLSKYIKGKENEEFIPYHNEAMFESMNKKVSKKIKAAFPNQFFSHALVSNNTNRFFSVLSDYWENHAYKIQYQYATLAKITK